MPKKQDDTIAYLVALLAEQAARIDKLQQRLDEIDAVWPQIIGEDDAAD